MTKKRRAHIKKRHGPPKVKPVAQPLGYEYIVEDIPTSISAPDLEVKLNSLGAENWYLLVVGSWQSDNIRFCFVRDSKGKTNGT